MILQYYLKVLQPSRKEHEERYRKLLANIEGDLVFSKRRRCDLAVFKLWTYLCWKESTGGLSGM